MDNDNAHPGPVTEIREGMNHPRDPRGNRAPDSFTIVSSIDNGGVFHADTNTVTPPPFGCC